MDRHVEVKDKMGKSKISWTDYTFNPWIGCTKISEGCVNCYAERDNKFRNWNPNGWGKGVPRHRTSGANWLKPHKWNNKAKADGIRYKVFCASLADVFDDEVDGYWRIELLALIEQTKNLDWLLLTKRPENVMDMVDWKSFPDNVWMGVTAENQKRADERIPELLKIPAKVRFVSAEPLLENIDFSKYMWPVHARWSAVHKTPEDAILAGDTVTYHRQHLVSVHSRFIDWIITGGESGKEAREMNPYWARFIQTQCKRARVSFFMKQMSGNTKALRNDIPEDLKVQEFPLVYKLPEGEK